MRILSYLMFLVAILAAGCGGGGGSPGSTPNDTPLFTTAPSTLTMRMGSSESFSLGGGRPPYTAVSNNSSIVVGVVDGQKLTLGGVSSGLANVTVRDDAGSTVTVGVTVTTPTGQALFTTAPATVNIAPKTVATFSIGGGVPSYTVTSNDTSVARVTQSDTSFTITPVALGTASLLIRDSVGTTVTVAVVVANKALALNPSEANSLIGFVNYAQIIGGVPPYTVVSGFPTAVTVSIGTLTGTTFTPSSSGNVLRMVANQAVDPAQVIVTDSAGNSVNFELTAEPGQPTFTFAPMSLEISEGAPDVTLLLYGATAGAVHLFTTAPGAVDIVTTPLTAAAGQATAVRISISATLCEGGTATITAVDSIGAIATAAISVANDPSNDTTLGCP